ncbi:MAG TPA: ISAzo13 family transposase [Kofleriaceae bacterium]|nr:ISAzo13 family transposase [Kofleriaceae bacterium]
MTTEHEIRRKYEALSPLMNERMRRCWAGVEAEALGRGGVAIVERATGMSRTTIRAGREELRTGVQNIEVVQVRRAGGGRPRLEERHPDLVTELESLIDPVTRGDSESPLRWTSKSVRKLAAELTERGKPISPQKVGQLLSSLGYRLTAMQKAPEGTAPPDRTQQFRFINDRARAYQVRNAPVISVDMKKTVFVAAYGLERDERQGNVNVNVDHHTPELAVASISHWWSQMGRKVYEEATELLITADAGCSHGRRSWLFKTELQRLADRTGLTVAVSLFPPGTSKWNRAEHRMSCHITEHWHDHQVVDHEIVVQLIGATRAITTPRVRADLDRRMDPIGIRGSVNDVELDVELEEMNLTAEGFHGDWNYTIAPRETESLSK